MGLGWELKQKGLESGGVKVAGQVVALLSLHHGQGHLVLAFQPPEKSQDF